MRRDGREAAPGHHPDADRGGALAGRANTRAGDAIVRDARKELTTALREVVAAAVARELGRTDKP